MVRYPRSIAPSTVASTQTSVSSIDAQVVAHEEALVLMQGYAGSGDNEALKAHATKTAHTIQQHYEHVQRLDE
jgi:predicted outer membrane protein